MQIWNITSKLVIFLFLNQKFLDFCKIKKRFLDKQAENGPFRNLKGNNFLNKNQEMRNIKHNMNNVFFIKIWSFYEVNSEFRWLGQFIYWADKCVLCWINVNCVENIQEKMNCKLDDDEINSLKDGLSRDSMSITMPEFKTFVPF